jgi:O-antigen ligase
MNLGIAPGLSAKNVVLYCLVIWIVFEAVINGELLNRRFDYVPLHSIFLILIVLASFSTMVRIFVLPYKDYGIMYGIISLKGLIDHYLLIFVFLAMIRSSEEALWMMKAMLITVSIASAVSLVDMFQIIDLNIMSPRGDGRLQGPLGSSNAYGALMTFYIPTLFAFAYMSSGFSRIRWTFAAFICVLVMVFTASRGALVGLCFGAVPSLYILRRYTRAKYVFQVLALVIALTAVAISVLAIQHGDLLYTRFIETSTANNSFDQTSGRTEIWSNAFTLMINEPVTFLTGFGWKTFSPMNGISSHSGYFEYLFNLGIIGLSLILSIYFSVIKRLTEAMESLAPRSRLIVMGCIFGFMSILVSNLFTNILGPWLFIWTYLSAVLRFVVSDQLQKTEKKSEADKTRVASVSLRPRYHGKARGGS